MQLPVDPPYGPVVYRLGRLSLTQAERVRLPPGLPFPALWRSSKRSGLISRVSKVRVLPASPSTALSSNGQDACLSNRERGFNPRQGLQSNTRRSSSNGQSISPRTRRLGDRTLRAAPAHRDRLIDRTAAPEAADRGLNPCPGAISRRSSTAEHPRDMRRVGRSNRPAGTRRAVVEQQTHRSQKAARATA